MITISCVCCGKEFKTYPSKLKDGRTKYCSRICLAKALAQRYQSKTFEERFGSRKAEQVKEKISSGKVRISPISKGRLDTLYWESKLSVEKIATQVGCSTDTILRWMRNCGLSTREKDAAWTKDELEILSQGYSALPKIQLLGLLGDRTWSGTMSKASRLGLCRDPSIYRNQRPSEPEQQLLGIVSKHGLPFKYVGNGSLFINGLNPDFVDTDGTNKVIEVFGRVFHDPERSFFKVPTCRRPNNRKAILAQAGYRTLIIWDDELSSEKEIVGRIEAFING